MSQFMGTDNPALSSEPLVKAVLHSGEHAVYAVEERHLRALYPAQSLNSQVISLGRLVAVRNVGNWYDQRAGRASWSVRITEPRTIELLEALPLVED